MRRAGGALFAAGRVGSDALMQAITAPMAMGVAAAPAAWLRSRRFDLWLIAGTAALGLAAGSAGLVNRNLILPLVTADLWLLAFPHVVATYTRLCFDRTSLRTHLGLVTWLPVATLAGTLALAGAVGPWVLTSTYFYWQWWHYTRQSWGIAQIYRRKVGADAAGPERLYQAAFFLLPLWGILHRSAQGDTRFIGVPLRVIPVAEPVVTIVAAAAVVTLLAWGATRVAAWLRGELALTHTLYVTSHVAVFTLGYLLIPGITSGWLAMNVWHNAQYLLFVWHFNNKRFASGVDVSAPSLSTLCQTRNAWRYALAGLAISTVAYGGLDAFGFATIAVMQAINFHHYVVDSSIWKVRRRPLQETLGLASQAA
jgi:hypothetical protein